jgi:hypothetical protein
MGERPYYEEYIAYLKRMKWDYKQQMVILLVPFSTEHKEILGNVKNLMEHHIVAIHPHFEKLITAIRTAKENEGNLDKEGTVYDDLFDAFRLSLKYYIYYNTEMNLQL